MKKLVIAGSSKLHERALYWRGYFEGRGYEVIDWPCPSSTEAETFDEPQTAPGLSLGRWLRSSDADYAERLTKVYQRFYKNVDQADVFFLMNEDKDGIEGYIGPSSIAEVTYAVIGNLNRGKNVEINILKMPSKEQACYDEVKFWLDQKWVQLYHRPTGKKATIPVPDDDKKVETPISTPIDDEESAGETSDDLDPKLATPPAVLPVPAPQPGFFGGNHKSIDILTCKKKCLRSLTPEVREYLKVLSPDFPAWLLKYIAAPEVQRLSGVSIACGLDHTSLYSYRNFHSTFEHSIGVALIIWHFTRDKKQTLAGLFHDIASPAFKHSIDFMNGDSETQESTEARTAEIIRDSRAIMRQLKKDGILASEVSDYHLYPIADNDSPNLAADRLEYTLANGLFLYDIWNLDKVKTFYNNLAILKNENDLDELGFQDADLCAEFTQSNLSLSAIYHSEKSRATMQFIADILQSMIINGDLSTDDLYIMSEREIVDWVLSCGDKEITEAFRNFQRATTVYSGATAKKNCYCTSVKAKIRYIVPLVYTAASSEESAGETSDDEKSPTIRRITEVSTEVDEAVKTFLDEKQPKYVGFDFDFKPYTE